MDIDRPGAALAWDDANLPEPAWTSMNPANGHAHLAWGLDAPVLLGDHDRQKPMRYLAAVEAGMREVLDADPGYSGLITKNPTNPAWRTLWARAGHGVYDLGFLSEHLDLPRFVDRRRKPEEIGLGRNVTCFDWLRHLAYREIRGYKAASTQGVYVAWLTHLYHQALQRNGDFAVPLDHREIYHVAKSVAKWVWRNFDIEASDKRFRGRQQHRGAMGGKAKGRAYEDRRARSLLLRAAGHSYQQIADTLGVSRRAVIYWCK